MYIHISLYIYIYIYIYIHFKTSQEKEEAESADDSLPNADDLDMSLIAAGPVGEGSIIINIMINNKHTNNDNTN